MAMKNTACSPDTFACALTTSGERNNIIIIISYFDWVAISLRLLLRPPVSHTLAHTHNQIKSNLKLFGGCSRSSSQLSQVGGRGVQGKKTPSGTQVEWCLLSNA